MTKQPNPNRPEYARIIAEARERNGWTQAQLGRFSKRDQASIKKYEGGKVVPPFFVLTDLANELSIDKKRIVRSVLSFLTFEQSQHWLKDAFNEVYDDVFAKGTIDADIIPSARRVWISYDNNGGTVDLISFLLKVDEIRRFCRYHYEDMLMSKVGALSIDVSNGKITDKNINHYIFDESLYP